CCTVGLIVIVCHPQEKAMRTMLKLTLATFAGVAMGGFAIQVINAQSKPPRLFCCRDRRDRSGCLQNLCRTQYLGRQCSRGSLPGAGWQDHSYGWRATETCRDHRLGKRRQSKGMVHFGCLQGTIRDKAAKFRGFIAEGVSP